MGSQDLSLCTFSHCKPFKVVCATRSTYLSVQGSVLRAFCFRLERFLHTSYAFVSPSCSHLLICQLDLEGPYSSMST